VLVELKCEPRVRAVCRGVLKDVGGSVTRVPSAYASTFKRLAEAAILVVLGGAYALKSGHDEGRHALQWFGPGSVPGDVVPIGDTVIQLARYGPPRPSYGPRPLGAETLYFQYPPALLPDQPKLRIAELLRELEFADGYLIQSD
jgi:hypothetical protein